MFCFVACPQCVSAGERCCCLYYSAVWKKVWSCWLVCVSLSRSQWTYCTKNRMQQCYPGKIVTCILRNRRKMTNSCPMDDQLIHNIWRIRHLTIKMSNFTISLCYFWNNKNTFRPTKIKMNLLYSTMLIPSFYHFAELFFPKFRFLRKLLLKAFQLHLMVFIRDICPLHHLHSKLLNITACVKNHTFPKVIFHQRNIFVYQLLTPDVLNWRT